MRAVDPLELECSTVDISLVAVCCNADAVLPQLLQQLNQVRRRLHAGQGLSSEIVLVDDGSDDETWQHIRRAAEDDSEIRGYRLGRRFGQQAALLCGLRKASGRVMVTLDADLQNPTDVILEMVARWRDGFPLVLGRRRRDVQDTLYQRAAAAVSDRLMVALGMTARAAGCTDFRLLTRRCAEVLCASSGRHLCHRYTVTRLGMPMAFVEYDRPRGASGTPQAPTSASRLPLALAAAWLSPLQTLELALVAASVWVAGGAAVAAALGFSGLASSTTTLGVAAGFLLSAQFTLFALVGCMVATWLESFQPRPRYVVAQATPAVTRPEPSPLALMSEAARARFQLRPGLMG